MIKLSEFRGQVEMAGKAVEVLFTENILTITGITCEEALGFIGMPSVQAVPAPAEVKTAPKTAAKKANGAAEKAPEPEPTQAPKAVATQVTKPVVETAKPDPLPIPKVVVTKAPEALMPGEEGDDPWGLGGDGAVPEELVTAKRMKDVLVFLQERGHHTEDSLATACEKLKERVPVLSRVENIPDRVKRTLEVMGYES